MAWTLFLSGYSLEIRVFDDNFPHNSTAVVQLIAEGLERVSEISRARNHRMPSKLIIVGDNTVRELKNRFVLSYISNLLAQRKMRLAGCFFLRKSHTHCRVDQLWGVIARRIMHTDTLLSAEETGFNLIYFSSNLKHLKFTIGVCECLHYLHRRGSNLHFPAQDTVQTIRAELSRPGVRAWLGSRTELHVYKMDVARAWRDHWKPQGITLTGGLLEDATGIHVFLLMQRKGRPARTSHWEPNHLKSVMKFTAGLTRSHIILSPVPPAKLKSFTCYPFFISHPPLRPARAAGWEDRSWQLAWRSIAC